MEKGVGAGGENEKGGGGGGPGGVKCIGYTAKATYV